MFRRKFFCVLLPVCGLLAQLPYPVPLPPQKDLPYLVHGDNLVATEARVAESRERRFDTVFAVPGEAAAARTPLASPIFVFDAGRIDAGKFQLYRLEAGAGHRELAVQRRGRGGAKAFRINVYPVSGGVYRIEAAESLPNGEYALTPDGTNDVFCFTVY